MGSVVIGMCAILVVGGAVLVVAAWLHHLGGSVESQARVRRWRFQLLWHAYRIRLRTQGRARTIRRRFAALMTVNVTESMARQQESFSDRGA